MHDLFVCLIRDRGVNSTKGIRQKKLYCFDMLFGVLPFVRTFFCPIPYLVMLPVAAQVVFIIKAKVEFHKDIGATFTVLLSPISKTEKGDFCVAKVFRDFCRIFCSTLFFLDRRVNYEEINKNKGKN